MTTTEECISFIINETTREEFDSLKAVLFVKEFLYYNSYLNINTDASQITTADKTLLIYPNASQVPHYIESRVNHPLFELEHFNNGYMVLFMENKDTNKAQFYSLNANTSETVSYTLATFFE